jgi:hypothetical protein
MLSIENNRPPDETSGVAERAFALSKSCVIARNGLDAMDTERVKKCPC